jgi:oligoribonuclease NrnB/cAMP/cGMP phosphodiesterase (DHH superfamily)
MKIFAIYHKDCIDGTTAAAIVLKRFPEAILFPLGHYGNTPEDIDAIVKAAKTAEKIFTVDCAIGAKELLKAGLAVTTIDHHIGIKEEMSAIAKDNPSFTFVFDNEKSGASLSWSYFFPGEPLPEIVKFVEDRDIWKNAFGGDTDAVNNYLFMYMNKPEEVIKFLDAPVEDIKRDGNVISRYAKIIIEHASEGVEPIMVRVGEYIVPFYNIAGFRSEIGNILCEKNGKAVGLFSIDGDKVKISLRSKDGQTPSALDLAKKINGGGHRNDSGAGMTLKELMSSIVAES